MGRETDTIQVGTRLALVYMGGGVEVVCDRGLRENL